MRLRGRRSLPLFAVFATVALLVSLLATGVAAAVVEPMSIQAVRPEDPSVSGSRLVWADKRGAGYHIYAYDALTRATRRLTPDGADHIQPSVSGDLVVWADYRNGDADIWAYDFRDGSQRPVVVANGDQVSPTVSGKWLVYEDRSSSYNPSVKVLDLSTGSLSTLASYGRRPRVSGHLAVWEDCSTSRVDSNIKGRNLATGVTYGIASDAKQELLPATDGRFVAWAEGNGTDLDIRYYDTQTGRYGIAGAGRGEQSFPAVGNGVVYWLDNVPGKRIQLVTYDIEAGRRARYNDCGTEDLGAAAVSGANVAWLAKAGKGWQIRLALDGGTVAASSLGRLAPSPLTPSSLARLTADPEAPEVVSTSVERGERNVSDSAFSVRFSEPVDPASVNGRTLRLLDGKRRPVRGRVRYSALTRAATFTPADRIAGGTYTLSVGAGIADTSGNTLVESQLITFSTLDVLADTSAPSAPGAPVARVHQGDQIALSWNASSDDVGVTEYLVYRSNTAAPITGFPAGADYVTTSASTGATFAATPAEVASSFTYYYVIVARDAQNNTSAASLNAAPDPHGTFTSGRSTNLCMRCHGVHGSRPKLALGAKSAEACYECHGETSSTTAYGAASSIDVQAQFGDDSAIASGGPSIAGRGSVHRNSYMAVVQRECDGCHTPHKRAYDPDPAKSYNKLLRTQLSTAPATYRYNTDAAAVGNRFCADCHGASSTNIGIVGGATAYVNTGGDHMGAYGTSAHATSSVPANNANPSIQCEACHNNHAAPVAKLIDYRDSGATDQQNDQSGLCYKCHSATGPEPGKPNTWNGRDVKAEFQRRSHHPYTAAGPAQVLSGQWSQTTAAEFATGILNSVVTTAGGSGTSGAMQLQTVGAMGPTVFADGFESNDFSQWDAAPTYWQTSTADKYAGTYAARGYATSTTRRTSSLTKAISVTGRTNIQLAYAYRTVALGSGDSFAVDYSTDGGTNWTPLFSTTTANSGWQTRTESLPANANVIRFTSSIANTSRYCYLDAVSVTADPVAGAFVSSGNAVSSLAYAPVGTLTGWGDLVIGGDEPAGTAMTVDVLDGADDSVIPGFDGFQYAGTPLTISLATIDPMLHPQLKVRANLQGNGPAARTVADAFADSSIDPMWTDALLNASPDPDAAGTRTLFTDGFETGDAGSWEATSPAFAVNSGSAHAGTYKAECYISNSWGDTARTGNTYLVQSLDTIGLASPTLTYWYTVSGLDADDTFRVQYSTNGGGAWTDLYNSVTNKAWTQATYALPAASNLLVRFWANTGGDSNTTSYVRLDDVSVTYTKPATNLWPAEGGGYATLEAAGTDFGGTSDQGEFLYTAPAWITTADFDVKVNVADVADSNPGASGGLLKAGLMLRTGADTAGALAANAANVGVFVTSGQGAYFQWRATAGGGTSSAVLAGRAAPEWVRLSRRGSTFTAYVSDDGQSWTQVGTPQTLNLGATALVGPALSAHLTGSNYSDASFEDFLLTEVGLTASLSPRVDDWTIGYSYVPGASSGSLACANCHNPHVVQTGGAGVAWRVARSSSPTNTRNTSANTTDFCLGCHTLSAPAAVISASSLVPYSVGFRDLSVLPFFNGWDKSSGSFGFRDSGHYTTTGTKALCENCHDPHGSNNARLTAWTRPSSFAAGNAGTRDNTSTGATESNLCFQCHGNSGVTLGGFTGRTGTGGAGVNMDIATPMNQTYGHKSAISVSGVHADTETVANLGAGKRHAECVDCHDPHVARAGVHTNGQGEAGPAVWNAVGVRPTWGSTALMSAPTAYTLTRLRGNAGDHESYLCFKCHSSYVNLTGVTSPSGGFAQTNIAAEFNPANKSGHNVAGAVFSRALTNGSSTWAAPTRTSLGLSASWNVDSEMTCSDCHGYSGAGARGPHGSAVPFNLKYGSTTARWYTTNLNNWSATANMCNRCHTSNPHGNWADYRHDYSCESCHIVIPHGWKRPRMIGYRSDPAPYVTSNNDFDGVTGSVGTDNDISRDSCRANCTRHNTGLPSGAW